MAVKAFCAQQIPARFLLLMGSSQRPTANGLYLIFFAFLLLGALPNAVQAAPEANDQFAAPSAPVITIPLAQTDASALTDLLPTSGAPVPQLAVFDDTMQQFMSERSIQAGTLAISRNGVVIFNRGYGWKDATLQTPLQPDTLLRLASIDKILTAAAIKRLIAQGQLDPTIKVFPFLNITPLPGQTPDPRLNDITVQHLLDHQGGWDPQQAQFDPMFEVIHIAEALGIASPAEIADIARYMAGQPLQFTPGTQAVYSNFGFALLKWIVEQVAGQTLVSYMQTEFGLDADRSYSFPQDRDPREIWYSDPYTCPNVFDPSTVADPARWVPCADGGFHAGSHALTATSATLADFLTRFWISGDPRLPGENGYIYVFFGSVPGTFTAIYQRPDGVNFAAFFNQRTDPSGLSYEDIIQLFDTATDSVIEWPTAGVCDPLVFDEASLASAIRCINTAGPGTHTITLTHDISFTQPSPLLANPTATQVVIEGNGHTLDAGGNGRVLTIELVQNLTLRNITLMGGQTDINGLSPDGGGLSLVCGEDLACNWTLLNTVVRNNQAAAGGGIRYRCDYHGGGTLLVQDSVIRNNQASGAGGGLIYSSDEESGLCSVTLRNTLIEGNRAVEGGAFRILRPRVTIIDSTIRDNVATENGGGILARISDGFIDMSVRNTTISGNHAGENGGGVYIASPDQTFDIKLVNSTISGNTAGNGAGGGLYLRESNGSLHIALINSTVTQNTASQGAGVHIFDQDSYPAAASTLRLNNSIVADNLGSDCAGETAVGVILGGQRVTSFGHNLDSDGTCLTPEVRQASDIPNGNANLGPLANFGGPTLTHVLRPGSAAIDAGDDAVCAADPVNGVDQRGVTRPQGAHCDIGAVEVQADQSTTFAVTKFTDSNDGICDADCSLREAIGAANRNPGRDEIHLISGVYSVTIPTLVDQEGDTLDEDANAIGDLDIADDLLLTGSGAAATIIDGNGAEYIFRSGADRVFDVLATANVTIEDLTIRHGRVSEMGGGLSNSGTLALNRVHIIDNFAASGFSTGHGGGIFNDGVLTVTDSLIANNRAAGGEASYGEGGGIRNDGLLTLLNSSLVDNSTSDDNDTGIGGGLRNAGTAVLEGCTIRNNSTSISGEGGGIYNLGELTLTGCTITQNRALKGAGLADRGDAVTVATSFLTHNATYAESAGEGGAIYAAGGPFTITHSTIADNYGTSTGGGIAHSSAAPMTIIASTIARNRTDNAGGGIFNNLIGDVQPLHIINTTIYSNSAVVAGGIAIDGGPVTLLNSTVAGNRATSEGGGIGYATGVRLINTILAHNLAPSGPDCSMPADSLGNNLIGDPTGCSVTLLPTDLVGDPQLAPFVDDGTPGGGYLPLLSTSPAIDAGDDAICASNPVNGVDQRGVTRPQGAHCDIGAYEAPAPASNNLLFVTATSSGKAGGVKFRDEDILAYDSSADTWLMVFDGSDVGMTKDVDAFSFQSDGTLLLSFNGATTVGGLGDVDDSDIVRFTPTALGDTTAGVFALYLHGADVGLTTDSEDIDAIGFTADGHLVVSTIGNFAAPNVTGRDEDLFQLDNATFGNPSSGTWRLFFDGSTVGLANEDINGLWIDPAQPDLYLTVKDSFAFAGQSIDGNDIFVCTLTLAGDCTYQLFWDGDQHDTSAQHLNGVGIGAMPATFNPTVQANAAEQTTDADAATDDDSDDLDMPEENGGQIFLPLISR